MGRNPAQIILQKVATHRITSPSSHHLERGRKAIGKNLTTIIITGPYVYVILDVCVYNSGGVLEDEEF